MLRKSWKTGLKLKLVIVLCEIYLSSMTIWNFLHLFLSLCESVLQPRPTTPVLVYNGNEGQRHCFMSSARENIVLQRVRTVGPTCCDVCPSLDASRLGPGAWPLWSQCVKGRLKVTLSWQFLLPPHPPAHIHHLLLILRINLWPIRHPTQLNMIAFTWAHWC